MRWPWPRRPKPVDPLVTFWEEFTDDDPVPGWPAVMLTVDQARLLDAAMARHPAGKRRPK